LSYLRSLEISMDLDFFSTLRGAQYFGLSVVRFASGPAYQGWLETRKLSVWRHSHGENIGDSSRSRRLDQRTSINITPREALELVRKLAYDDDFRARVEREPQRTLQEFHINLPAEYKAAAGSSLPPKEEFQQVLTNMTLGEQFEQQTAAWPFLAFLAFLSN
jgi:putative modified peptide